MVNRLFILDNDFIIHIFIATIIRGLMSVGTYIPTQQTIQNICADEHNDSTKLIKVLNIENLAQESDNIRIMPTSKDLGRPSSDAQFIKQVLDKEIFDSTNLIASSHQTLPNITVNGVAIDPKAVAAEVQYHPANSQEEALFLASQALVMRELLRQEVIECLGERAWLENEEATIAKLLEQQVIAKSPDKASCQNYYHANQVEFVSTPIMTLRHILLACPPQEGEERIELKKQARQLIDRLNQSHNRDSDFIEFARRYSACPSKDDGGELGVLQKGSTVPEFESAVFALPVGISINPIETRYGIHVIEVLQKQEGRQLSFEEAYPIIENHLKQQSFHHSLCDYLFELSQKADIIGIELKMNEQNIYRG